MIKTIFKKLVPLVSVVLAGMFLLAACDSAPPRVPSVHIFNPGAAFTTNFNHDDPRRQVRASVVFEVLDEAAIDELTTLGFVIRNSVIAVLGELTMEELTTERNIEDIASRLVERVNDDLGLSMNLVLRAYFTDLAVI